MGRVVETEEPCQLRLGGGSHDVIYVGEVHTNYLRNQSIGSLFSAQGGASAGPCKLIQNAGLSFLSSKMRKTIVHPALNSLGGTLACLERHKNLVPDGYLIGSGP